MLAKVYELQYNSVTAPNWGHNLCKRFASTQTCEQPCSCWRYTLWILIDLCPTSSYALQPANRFAYRSQDQQPLCCQGKPLPRSHRQQRWLSLNYIEVQLPTDFLAYM